MFMRGDKDIDIDRYRIYRDEVLLPFIEETRIEFYDWDTSCLLTEDLKAVSWCDGD